METEYVYLLRTCWGGWEIDTFIVKVFQDFIVDNENYSLLFTRCLIVLFQHDPVHQHSSYFTHEAISYLVIFSFFTLNFIYFTTITHSYKLATQWSCWVENQLETFSSRKTTGISSLDKKTLSYACWLWDSNLRPPSNSLVVLTPKLDHRLNHSATEDWFFSFFMAGNKLVNAAPCWCSILH